MSIENSDTEKGEHARAPVGSLVSALNEFRMSSGFMRQVVAWERIPARKAANADFPPGLDHRLVNALQDRGIRDLYSHQRSAIDAASDGENVVVSTATASGKSLCYIIPVLSRLLESPTARALYLFPTKALAHDQLAEMSTIVSKGNLPVEVSSYDGDTTQNQRRKARQARGVLITNPDMIHAGILPQHIGWRDLFSNLHFIVVDEIHAYRGVFGSHVANVIRRLQRICRFYGSDPQYICCSATIANPKEHAERLIELPFKSIEEPLNGAPTGEKQFILYNPPLIDEELGMRRSSILEAKDVTNTFLNSNVQTVVFARARQTVELLLAYLQDDADRYGRSADTVVGYRGGYLPLERREIERGLRQGELRGVVATNALELGVDIGRLSAAVLTGYPGSIASTWQQAGRAGRRSDKSAVIMVASGSALDQYLCQHPKYLFGRTPENALCNPNNLRIMVKHLGCAAYELPLKSGESFGSAGTVDDLLDTLADAGLIYRTNEQYHWLGEGIPAHQVSLRTSGDDTVVIQDISGDSPVTIGEVDLESVPLLVYEGAIYMHQARTFFVESLDWDARLADVRPAEVDYYTRSSMGSTIRKLAPEEESSSGELTRAYGDVLLVTKASGFRKIRLYTHETLGFGEIDLPEIELDTNGYWIVFGERLTDRLVEEGLLARPNEYGPNWQQQRERALARDGYQCRTCGSEARPGKGLHVHHIRPFRDYGYIAGNNEAYRLANEIENLVTLCPSCHRQAEAGQQTRSALGGLAYSLNNLAPLFLMCDPGDIYSTADIRNPITRAPTVVIYERVAAGVGFSQRLFELHDTLLSQALEMVSGCGCSEGCPACVGPPGAIGPDTKSSTKRLLKILNQERNRESQIQR
jgi:DEAD/DEAH box helicase domain-containing protein